MDARLAIRRKSQFRNEESSLLSDLNTLDGVHLCALQLFTCYEIFDATETDIEALSESIICDPRVDELITAEEIAQATLMPSLGVEFLPGQYDQRADAATQALALLQPESTARIYSAKLLTFEPAPSKDALDAITHHLVNPVESRVKDFSVLVEPQLTRPAAVEEFSDFLDLDHDALEQLRRERAMAMSLDDLVLIQEYFVQEQRTPTDVELAALDTYWSDHCRHTTFSTELASIKNESHAYHDGIDRALSLWKDLREKTERTQRPRTLMDLGTIMARELRRTGALNSQEVSEEINACSVHVSADTPSGCREPWLLMFKNETHNHPTEIEPFGGASTCLGGAIRDPLSGRSWVYQGLRISGSGDVSEPRSSTLPGKLPQRDISTRATLGFSSYGNQIGMATTSIQEFVHPGYIAKHMELGAVVAAAPENNVRRLEPQAGDVVILLGGRTGRDGIGGATGSSKAHNEESLELSGAEVQKGNPVNERKIQRLFRHAEAAQLIVRCNDFGAGGVAVAVGELAEGLDIYLDRVPLKYSGLSPKEIAISESQERMAVVVRPADQERFLELALSENLEATPVATVTDTGRLRMFMNDAVVLDLSRSFLDTNGAQRNQDVVITDPDSSHELFAYPQRATLEFSSFSGDESALEEDTRQSATPLLDHLSTPGLGQQIGMIEQFDATVGRGTVLMPLGGKYQRTVEGISAQTLPVPGGSSTTSVVSYGYSPAIADHSPYLMGAYSVVEALAKLCAAGADISSVWLTVQEYFQRPDDDARVWGDVTQALLGLLEAQNVFGVAAIGGKDSMSGSFGDDLHVPPTLVTFAVSVQDASDVISASIPEINADLWYLPHTPLDSAAPNYAQLRANFTSLRAFASTGAVCAASAIKDGGILSAVVNMCVGNAMSFIMNPECDLVVNNATDTVHDYLTKTPIGGIVFAVPQGTKVSENFSRDTSYGNATPIFLGTATPGDHNSDGSSVGVHDTHEASTHEPRCDFGIESFSLSAAIKALDAQYSESYPLNARYLPTLPDFALKIHDQASSESDALAHESAVKDLDGVAQQTVAAHDAADSEKEVEIQPHVPHVVLPVFPGTNSEYDMAEAFEAAGATTEFVMIRNLTSHLLQEDIERFIHALESADILAFSGGFSLGDEPDGSAKFIANFLRAQAVSKAVKSFVNRDNLVLGVCNGFQALVKSGFLPYGDPDRLHDASPTLTHNAQLRHVSRIATTRVSSTDSPWLSGFEPGMIHKVPVSHGEGRFVVDERTARELFRNGQVAFQYVDFDGIPTASAPENPNGSAYAIEGIISPDGRILGKMGHPERFRPGLMKNIPEIATQDIFYNAVQYCARRKVNS